ncbi:hypothetical protein CAPTEDRAFT_197061 [Capitella teleta]|uniref:Endonuclease/exonuclease/phosphatase domain-containing protein n=1 Tax=Capitella teleta TaxID=283909 RepID=R7URR8_CAPTE|nr:hypothetical protein CAPTEDRAFT_197061 [Capitella teleta]|eukprot:ELU09219.1 hypothetical protein CAPTEDRAFT_197061 [Capitella teleta]
MKSLAECICEFYNPDEIYVAREMLWDVYGQPITACGAKKTRRVQPPAYIQTARPFADDITSWVGMLVNSHPEEMCTKFYALDLRRVPPCPPEEINIFSVVARITALEKSLEASLNANASWPLPGDAPHGSRPQTANQFRSLPRESASKTMMRTDTQGATVNHTDPDPSWTKVIKKRTQKVEVRKKVRSAVKALPVVTGVGTDANLKGSTPVNHIFGTGLHEGDNTSDHNPVLLHLSVRIEHMPSDHPPTTSQSRVSWHRASSRDIVAYKEMLSICLEVDKYYDDIVRAMRSSAEVTIPVCKKRGKAGWSTHVKQFQEDAIFWNRIWVENGRPTTGSLSNIRRSTRAQYRRASRWVVRNQDKLSADRMAQALASNNSRDLWGEVKKKANKVRDKPIIVDDADGELEVCEMFKVKYESLYSSVSFNENDMNEFIDQLTETNFSIIALTENWPTESNKILYEIPNYNSIHSVRVNQRGGGVSIYTDSFLNFKHRPDLNIYNIPVLRNPDYR